MIYNNKNGIAITVDDNSYMSLNSVTLFDYEHQTETTQTFIYPFTFGSVRLPFTSKVGDVKVKAKNYSIDILNDGNDV